MSSVLKLFCARDTRVESLMVIGYNPSHSNINSEVNAPFKMLSTMLRFLDNETKPTKIRRQPIDFDPEEDSTQGKNRSSTFGAYKMGVNKQQNDDHRELGQDSGERMDTIGGGDDDYDDEDDGAGARLMGDLAEEDKLDVNLDDIEDEDDDDVVDLSKPDKPSHSSSAVSDDSGNALTKMDSEE